MLATKRLRRITLATWGDIPDQDLPDWRARFNIGDAHGHDGQRKLASSQIQGNTPLLLGGRYMDTIEQVGGGDQWPYLFIFGDAGFNEVVLFWNLRSRLTSWAEGRRIIGIPRELLSAQDLHPVRTWVDAPVGATHYKPDITFIAAGRDLPAARAAFKELGFQRAPKNAQRQHSWPRPPEGREGLEYSEWPRWPSGPTKRGAAASTLVTIADRHASLEMPTPEGVKLPFGHLRLAIRGLPLPLPMNGISASHIIPNAYVSQDGMTVLTTTGNSRWGWDIRLPDQNEALDQWAASHGFTVSSSQPGLYGLALLGRLSDLEELDSLANDVAVAILGELAPKSTKKVSQRIANKFAEDSRAKPGVVSEEKLIELLRDEGLLLRVEAKTLHQIASATEISQSDLISPLATLVEAGLLRRGVDFRCPQCGFHQLFPINEMDERVSCQACRMELVVPVKESKREYPTSYFLDGLAARLMEEDLLSVILALRKARLDIAGTKPFFAWPGLLFKVKSQIDADLLVSDGTQVSIFECKARAGGLTWKQTKKLLGLCQALNARPGIAALSDSFDPKVAAAIRAANGLVYEEADLFSAAQS
jgi:hypothetical protein